MINLYLEKLLPSRNNLKFSYPSATNRVNFQQAVDSFTSSANLCKAENKSDNSLPSFLGRLGKKHKKTEKTQAGIAQSPVISEPPPQIPEKFQAAPKLASEIYYQSLLPASYKY